jgi:hypothetical protein
LLSTAEICWRIKSALEGVEMNEIQPNLNLEDLLDKYHYCCRAVGIKQDRASRMNEGAIAVMCNVMATMGVESKVILCFYLIQCLNPSLVYTSFSSNVVIPLFPF